MRSPQLTGTFPHGAGRAIAMKERVLQRAGAVACAAMLFLSLGSPSHGGPVALHDAARPAERAAYLDTVYSELKVLPKIQRQVADHGKRRALIIGNDRYQELDPLKKAVGDAEALAKTLTDLGFEVTLREDVGLDAFDDALEDFYQTLQEGDTVFLFYSGHGVAYDNANYLLPVDTPRLGSNEGRKIWRVAIDASQILAEIEKRGAQVALVVLDACRNNPFARDGGRGAASLKGLAPIEPDRGIFLIYSAGIGEEALDSVAPDDPDPNSVFTRKFLPILKTPGLPLVDIAKRTQVEVRALTRQLVPPYDQAPAYYDQVVGQYYFVPPRPRLFGMAIGVDKYVNYQLRGAVNDAESVARALEALGADKVVRFYDDDASVPFIEYVWRDMLEDANPGDTIVLSYAGASGHIPAEHGDEAGGFDEVLVLGGVDVKAASANPAAINRKAIITDNELTDWMEEAAAKNVNVVLLTDGCDGGGLLDRPFANVSFISGSAENETVYEYEIDGRKHGIASVGFAEALGGAADYNGDGFISQRELFHFVSRFVFDKVGTRQNPSFLPDLASDQRDLDAATDIPLFQLPADIVTRTAAALAEPWPGDDEAEPR
jgi:uncharacterized caspase-like protein